MTDLDTLQRVMRPIVEEQLAPARVVELRIEEGEGFDGEAILRVVVVIEMEQDVSLGSRALGLLRHLREPMAEVNEDRFPVFSFMKPGELDGAAA